MPPKPARKPGARTTPKNEPGKAAPPRKPNKAPPRKPSTAPPPRKAPQRKPIKATRGKPGRVTQPSSSRKPTTRKKKKSTCAWLLGLGFVFWLAVFVSMGAGAAAIYFTQFAQSNEPATRGAPTASSFPTTSPSLAPSASPVIAPTHSNGVQGYDIDYVYLTPIDPGVKQAFEDARNRWSEIIETKPGHPYLGVSRDWCNVGVVHDADDEVEDLIVYISVLELDGTGGLLGSAGPCATSGGIPIFGKMRFDSFDMTALLNSGRLTDVIMHELGHILGIGTLWSSLTNTDDPTPWFYKGTNGVDAWDTSIASGGLGQTGEPPVEEDGGSGTAGGHWDEVALNKELMTGYVDDFNPASILTVRSLQDLGYTVDVTQADAYTVPARRRLIRASTHIPYGDDIERMRVVEVDEM